MTWLDELVAAALQAGASSEMSVLRRVLRQDGLESPGLDAMTDEDLKRVIDTAVTVRFVLSSRLAVKAAFTESEPMLELRPAPIQKSPKPPSQPSKPKPKPKTVNELRLECIERGIDPKGLRKAELIAALEGSWKRAEDSEVVIREIDPSEIGG